MRRIMLVTLPSSLFAGPASAHVGTGVTASFASGLAHPLTGMDHIAVMVAVGMWAALKGGRALYVWPATFIGVMLTGGALGMAHVPLPGVEPAIIVSVVTLGLFVALRVEPPLWAGALTVGAFAVFHGHAHGSEVAGTVSGTDYMAGFALATAGLHALGIAFVVLICRVHARAFTGEIRGGKR